MRGLVCSRLFLWFFCPNFLPRFCWRHWEFKMQLIIKLLFAADHLPERSNRLTSESGCGSGYPCPRANRAVHAAGFALFPPQLPQCDLGSDPLRGLPLGSESPSVLRMVWRGQRGDATPRHWVLGPCFPSQPGSRGPATGFLPEGDWVRPACLVGFDKPPAFLEFGNLHKDLSSYMCLSWNPKCK